MSRNDQPGVRSCAWWGLSAEFRRESTGYRETLSPFQTLPVTVRAGATTKVRWRPLLGGNVRFTLRVDESVAGEDVRGLGTIPQDIRRFASTVDPEVIARYERIGSLGFVFSRKPGHWIGGFGNCPPDVPLTAQGALPPGVHTLLVRSKDFRDVLCPVVIRPGEMTDVELWLRRK